MSFREPQNSILDSLISVVDRNLTYISMGVAVVGVLLIVSGPASGLFGGDEEQQAGNAISESEAEQGEAPDSEALEAIAIVPPQDASGFGEDSSAVLERQPQPFTIVPARERGEVITYTIEPGDTLFDLSESFGINKETIFWSNTNTLLDDVHLLIPGTEIYVLPTDGVYYRASGEETIDQIANRFLADTNGILQSPYNELPEEATDVFRPPLGMRLVIPDGQRERIDFQWIAPSQNNSSSNGSSGPQSTRFAPGHPGSCAAQAGGGGTGAWSTPIGNYSLTQGFFYGHSGIDLSAVTGEPVLAADTGRVVFAGWNNWGFGNLVVLDHGNGWTTFYAHMSSINVRCGQLASRGTQLGGVGSTGNSTGSHLHFEMRWFLNPDNPAAYIGF